MEQGQITNYNVSKQTAAYFDVLKAMNETSNKFIMSLDVNFGDNDCGIKDKRIQTFWEREKELEQFIWECIRESVYDQMGELCNNGNVL